MRELVLYSMCFKSEAQVKNWAARQLSQLRKFGVTVYIIKQGKRFLVAREFSPSDDELAFLTKANDYSDVAINGISFRDVIENSKKLNQKSHFVTNQYKVVCSIFGGAE